MSSQASPSDATNGPEPSALARIAVAVLALAFFIWPFLVSQPLREGGAVGNELIHDGLKLVTQHEVLTRIPNEPSALFDTLTTPWWGSLDPKQALYRPLSSFVLGLGALLSGEPYDMENPGLSPVPFKLFALALKVICSLLVVELGWRLLRNAKAAFIAGALFATLPVHGEVLFDVAGTAELLAAAFSIAAWIAWVKAGDRPLSNLGGVLIAALFAFLASMSKESAFALPLVLFLSDIGSARAGSFADGLKAALAKLPALAIVVAALAISLGIRYAVLGTLSSTYEPYNELDNPLIFVDGMTRAMNGFRLTAASLLVMVGINPLSSGWNYNLDYSYAQILPKAALSVWNLVGLASLGLIVLLSVAFYSKCRTRAGLALALLGSLLLTSNIVFPIGTIFAERLLFFPSVIVVLFLSPFFARIGKAGVAVALLLALGGGFWSFSRVEHYASRLQAWSYTSRTTGRDSARAHFNLGVANIQAQMTGPANFSFEKATQLYPKFADAFAARGALSTMLLEYDDAAEALQSALEIQIERTGGLYVPEGSAFVTNDPSVLLYQLTQVQAVDPGLHPDRHLAYLEGLLAAGYQSPYVQHRRAETLRSLGRFEESEQAFRDSIAIEPTPSAIGALVRFLRLQGRDAESRQVLSEQLARLETSGVQQSDAARIEFLLLRGDAELLDDPKQALATSEQALALKPTRERLFRTRILEAQALADIVPTSGVEQARNDVRAAQACREGLAAWPAETELHVIALQALAQYEMAQDRPQAAQAVIISLLNRSEAATLRARLATLQIRAGDREAAAKSLELAIEGLQQAEARGLTSPRIYLETRLMQLLNLRALGTAEAEEALSAELLKESAKGNPIHWTVLIQWYLSQDEFDAAREAADSLRAALPLEETSGADAFDALIDQMNAVTEQLNPERNDPALLEQMANMRLEVLDRPGAERELTRALELTTDDADDDRAQRLFLMARTVEPVQGGLAALQYLEQALALPGVSEQGRAAINQAAERLRILTAQDTLTMPAAN